MYRDVHKGSQIGHSFMPEDKPIHNTNAASTHPKQAPPPPTDQRLQTLCAIDNFKANCGHRRPSMPPYPAI